MTGLPQYVWDLLDAAKMVVHPPCNATPERLVHYQQQLNQAVTDFEAHMPVNEAGCVVVSEVQKG